uniref:NADH-ubiquinone oxidoreductase chain 4 n=1 Tax=Iassus lateralis TaxID=3054420 RepID=A0AA50A9F8_9HEMI|nr:NADH dehydrogenase subunit 4 [Iassus lateralis]WIW75751.1 NADH dehydrogenase subunit 4 [Iassus lateralis]WKW94151.1 NADH dehydrogenase subunit 4 [Iassus lateralis]WLN32156.1 NADH dehydrogenase subunit 4 [Iassus lateralis]
MMVLFYFLSLILFFNFLNLYIIQFIIILGFFIFLKINFLNFYCSISYFLGFDFYSFWMMFLLIFIMMFVYLSFDLFNETFFYIVGFFLFMSLFLVFYSLNILLMYFFFEFSLIPMILIVFGWGYQPERLISGFYLFFYTLFSSLPLLIFIFYLSKNYSLFFDLNFNLFISMYLNFCLIFSFLVKFPMFMLHFWLPKAHVQAPLVGSMLLAGILLKIGGYGIIRFMMMFEDLFVYYNYIWYSIVIYGCFMVSYICLIQSDMKFMIAYSSISHMSMCIMGLITFMKLGFLGSFLMLICHGFCSSGLFFLANLYYKLTNSRSFFINKGMLNYCPSLGFFWFIFCFINMSCPPSVNFLSEFLIMSSMVSYCYVSIIYMFMIFFFVSCFNFYLFSYLNHGDCYYIYSINLVSLIDYFIILFHLFYLFMLNFYYFLVLF